MVAAGDAKQVRGGNAREPEIVEPAKERDRVRQKIEGPNNVSEGGKRERFAPKGRFLVPKKPNKSAKSAYSADAHETCGCAIMDRGRHGQSY